VYRYIVDCARLAAVSRECNVAVSANSCWREVMAALEHDFPLVEHVALPEHVGLDPSTWPDPEEAAAVSRAKGYVANSWRVKMEDPRYDVSHPLLLLESWEAASDMVRFGRLLFFAQSIVAVLSAFPANVVKANIESRWHYDFNAEDFAGPEADTYRQLYHLQKYCVERYVMATRLAFANIAERGFHQGAGGQGAEPYHVVNDHMEDYQVSDGAHLDFGSNDSSFCDWMDDLFHRDDCGGAVQGECNGHMACTRLVSTLGSHTLIS
jgi:hypothetical protein